MISSLILQWVVHLPYQFRTELDLSPGRLGLIDKDAGSVADKLNLLSDLRSLVPKFIICVVDCLQILENRSDRAHIHHLQQVIYCLAPSMTTMMTWRP